MYGVDESDDIRVSSMQWYNRVATHEIPSIMARVEHTEAKQWYDVSIDPAKLLLLNEKKFKKELAALASPDDDGDESKKSDPIEALFEVTSSRMGNQSNSVTVSLSRTHARQWFLRMIVPRISFDDEAQDHEWNPIWTGWSIAESPTMKALLPHHSMLLPQNSWNVQEKRANVLLTPMRSAHWYWHRNDQRRCRQHRRPD